MARSSEGAYGQYFQQVTGGARNLAHVYATWKYGPTAMSVQPLRIVFMITFEATARLLSLVSLGNRTTVVGAPVPAILAADADFTIHMEWVLPLAVGAKDSCGGVEDRQGAAGVSAALRVGEEFFSGTNINSQILVGIDHPGETP